MRWLSKVLLVIAVFIGLSVPASAVDPAPAAPYVVVLLDESFGLQDIGVLLFVPGNEFVHFWASDGFSLPRTGSWETTLDLGVGGAAWRAREAAVISYNFNGTVLGTIDPPPFGLIANPGSPVAGTFKYDVSTLDSQPGNHDGSYFQIIPGGMAFSIAGTPVVSDIYHVGVLDGAPPVLPYDELDVFSSWPGTTVGGIPQASAEMDVRFRDNTAVVFTNDGLPDKSLTIDDFDDADGILRDSATGGQILFTVDWLSGDWTAPQYANLQGYYFVPSELLLGHATDVTGTTYLLIGFAGPP